MTDFLFAYGLFFLKVFTLLVAIVLAVMMVSAVVGRNRQIDKGPTDGYIEIRKFNDSLEDMERALSLSLMPAAEQKEAEKARKKQDKAEKKAAKAAAKKARQQRGEGQTIVAEPTRHRLYVLNFKGDLRASDVSKLRREITAVLTTATSDDEILVRLESGGGMVTSYGLAASQLDRIRASKVPLTICVDKVAASGGYMMACVADKLVAAPFAVLGSIGVVAQIPNFHRLLKELNIDFELLTAGKYKRTLTVFGENTDEARQKFIEDIERIHQQFKQYVGERRPQLDVEAVSTGEIWSGQDTLDLGLADQLATSDEYMIEASEDRDVLLLAYKKKKRFSERLAMSMQNAIDGVLIRWLERLWKSRLSIG